MSTSLTLLSLGAGVQSTTLLMLSAQGELPMLDGAVFADTGWEPKAVYEHLDRLEEEIAKPAGIPIYRVGVGNIRNDALDPDHRFALMPLYVKNLEGKAGMARRQCTAEYKVRPIKEQVRLLLGAKIKANGRPGQPPRGAKATQWIGISMDEIQRAKDSDVKYVDHDFPLLDMRWTRQHCIDYLEKSGWGTTPKSACIGCPFHHDSQWRELRDNYPEEWQDAVEFDRLIRKGSARANAQGQELRGEMYLHPSLKPLDEAPLERRTKAEMAADGVEQFTFLDLLESEVFTCSPFSCRGDDVVIDRLLREAQA